MSVSGETSVDRSSPKPSEAPLHPKHTRFVVKENEDSEIRSDWFPIELAPRNQNKLLKIFAYALRLYCFHLGKVDQYYLHIL